MTYTAASAPPSTTPAKLCRYTFTTRAHVGERSRVIQGTVKAIIFVVHDDELMVSRGGVTLCTYIEVFLKEIFASTTMQVGIRQLLKANLAEVVRVSVRI